MAAAEWLKADGPGVLCAPVHHHREVSFDANQMIAATFNQAGYPTQAECYVAVQQALGTAAQSRLTVILDKSAGNKEK